MFINPDIYGIQPGCDATVGFIVMAQALRDNVAKKTLKLQKGTYYFKSADAAARRLFVTNTVGEDEYKQGEEKNIHRIAVNLEGIHDLEIDGQGSTFLFDGKLTNMVIDGCENITVKNVTFKAYKPDIHKFTVLSASPFYAMFKLDEESDYVEEKGKFYFTGTDYKTDFMHARLTAGWIPTAKPENYHHLVRTGHPFKGAISFKETAPRVFKARYISPVKLIEGQIFHLYRVKRANVGVFIQNSKNVTLENVRQSCGRSLALVAQNSEELTFQRLDFAPEPDGEIEFASPADFIQICMCRGAVKVLDSVFDSAGDDAVNVHGFHFKIASIEGNKLLVKYCHPQSYGYECLREDDEVAFIDARSLLEKGTAHISSARLIDSYTYEVVLDTEKIPVKVGDVIEDLSACPDFTYAGNTIDRIVTRGMLVTTRGKVLIENNRFLNTGMSGILIADDAASWYESGPVRDVTIRGNAFMNCDGYAVLVTPEVKSYEAPVHENILIENNLFCASETGRAVKMRGVKNVTIRNNVYRGTPKGGKWTVFEDAEALRYEDDPTKHDD